MKRLGKRSSSLILIFLGARNTIIIKNNQCSALGGDVIALGLGVGLTGRSVVCV
jgi:hypothetical protein